MKDIRYLDRNVHILHDRNTKPQEERSYGQNMYRPRPGTCGCGAAFSKLTPNHKRCSDCRKAAEGGSFMGKMEKPC